MNILKLNPEEYFKILQSEKFFVWKTKKYNFF